MGKTLARMMRVVELTVSNLKVEHGVSNKLATKDHFEKF